MNVDVQSVLISSGIASIFATVFSNPFEVLKIRQQIQASTCINKAKNLQCTDSNLGNKFIVGQNIKTSPQTRYIISHTLKSAPTLPYHNSLILQQLRQVWRNSESIKRNELMKITIKQIECECLQAKSFIKTAQQIYMKEGFLTFFNGWRYALMHSVISNMCYFTFYEKSNQFLKNTTNLDRRILIPLITSGFSRFLTTTITLPLEYWRVLQSSHKGYTQIKNFQLGSKMNSAYLVTLQRDVIFSCLFWMILENSKHEMKKIKNMNEDIRNLVSGIIAGVTTASITLPLDVVKTRRQVSTRSDMVQTVVKNMSTSKVLAEIYQNEGFEGLFKGYKPRMIKVTVHAGLVYMMYEKLKKRISQQEKEI